jgi:hypothetical protein
VKYSSRAKYGMLWAGMDHGSNELEGKGEKLGGEELGGWKWTVKR